MTFKLLDRHTPKKREGGWTTWILPDLYTRLEKSEVEIVTYPAEEVGEVGQLVLLSDILQFPQEPSRRYLTDDEGIVISHCT